VPDDEAARPIDWPAQLSRLVEWTRRLPGYHPGGTLRRLKQWLALAARHGGFDGFESVKRAATVDDLLAGVRDGCGRELQRVACPT
jgi:hypothetical protein